MMSHSLRSHAMHAEIHSLPHAATNLPFISPSKAAVCNRSMAFGAMPSPILATCGSENYDPNLLPGSQKRKLQSIQPKAGESFRSVSRLIKQETDQASETEGFLTPHPQKHQVIRSKSSNVSAKKPLASNRHSTLPPQGLMLYNSCLSPEVKREMMQVEQPLRSATYRESSESRHFLVSDASVAEENEQLPSNSNEDHHELDGTCLEEKSIMLPKTELSRILAPAVGSEEGSDDGQEGHYASESPEKTGNWMLKAVLEEFGNLTPAREGRVKTLVRAFERLKTSRNRPCGEGQQDYLKKPREFPMQFTYLNAAHDHHQKELESPVACSLTMSDHDRVTASEDVTFRPERSKEDKSADIMDRLEASKKAENEQLKERPETLNEDAGRLSISSNQSAESVKWCSPAAESSICDLQKFIAQQTTSSVSSQGRKNVNRSRKTVQGRSNTPVRSVRRSMYKQAETYSRAIQIATCASVKPQPFKLITEERGKMKKQEFMSKWKQKVAEEEKCRIPQAQGLPWTTDEPELIPKPQVKDITIPLPIKLNSDVRAIERAEFDHCIAEKLLYLEQKRLEKERLRKIAEEQEIKKLRQEMIPKAQLMPYFDRPFCPKRSSKHPTVPKEPQFHRINKDSKRRKLITNIHT